MLRTGSPYIPDEFAQARAAFWLRLARVWGLRTDADAVERLHTEMRARMDVLNVRLKNAGVLKGKFQKGAVKWTRDMSRLREIVNEAYDGHPPMTKPKGSSAPQISTEREVLEDAPAKHMPDCTPDECSVTCRTGLLNACAERSGVEKILSTNIPELMTGTQVPINPGWNEMVATGRTSVGFWQNPPRKGAVRECVVPRPGMLFVSADYSFIELCALAQVCVDKFGMSKLAEAINGGLDPHLDLGADLLGITYEEAKRRKKEPEIKDARQRSKCFHPDTEVLTRSGWSRICDLDGTEEVVVADVHDGGDVRLIWEVPSRLTWRPNEDGFLVHLKNEGIDLRVTQDHRMVAFCAARSKVGSVKTVAPEDMSGVRYWPNVGHMSDGGLVEDEMVLRMAVAVQADGHYAKSGKIRLGFSKERKIERARWLFAEWIDRGLVTEAAHSNGDNPPVTSFSLDAQLSDIIKTLLDPDKTLPWWWLDLTPALRDAVVDEARHWDAHTQDNWRMYQYYSTIAKNIDVLQALASLQGRKSRAALNNLTQDRPGRADCYRLSIKDHHLTRGGNLEIKRIPYDGDVYCLTVSTDGILVRDGGTPVITRQCANFGLPGGLGAEKFMSYSWKQYGVRMSLEEAKALKPRWQAKWPEVKIYHNWVAQQCGAAGEFVAVQHRSRRARGRAYFTTGSNCVDYETEALTKRGWVNGHDLRMDDEILTKNPTTNELEWQRPLGISHFPDYEGPLVEFESTRFSAVTTPNHRWLVTKNGKDGNHCVTSATMSRHGDDRIHRTGDFKGAGNPDWSDDELRLAGWYATDGCRRGPGIISLFQTKPNRVAQIDALLEGLGVGGVHRRVRERGNVVWTIARVRRAGSDPDFTLDMQALEESLDSNGRWTLSSYVIAGLGVQPDAEVARTLGVTKTAVGYRRRQAGLALPQGCDNSVLFDKLVSAFPDRVLSEAFAGTLSAHQATILLETMIDGDGTRTESGQQFFYSESESAVNAVQTLAVIAGQSSKASYSDLSGRTIPKYDSMPNQPRSKGIWTVTFYRRTHVQVAKHQVREFVEKRPVWCPSVPNTYFVARRAGTTYITGNTFFQGLAADGAKHAGFNIARECYLEDPYGEGPTDLYGCRTVLFLHDEFILEVPEERAHDACMRLCYVMERSMRDYIPDVMVRAEPALMRRWYKGAEIMHDENGRLIPWEPS